MNEQRLFEEYSFSLKSQLNQFAYWFMELTPIQQMICSHLSMNIANDSSLMMNETFFKNFLSEKQEVLAAANTLSSLVKDPNNLLELRDFLKVHLACFRHSRCSENTGEIHATYFHLITSFFSVLVKDLVTREQFSLLDSEGFVQDVETIIGTFLLHPDFKMEEKQSISDLIMKSIKTIEPQSQPRLQEVERFLIYLLSLFDEVIIFMSYANDKTQRSPDASIKVSSLIKDFLHLLKAHNSSYSSLRSSGFISECDNSSSQASIPGTYIKNFPFRRESDDKYSYLTPGLYSQRFLPSRRQSASPFFTQHQASTSQGPSGSNNPSNGTNGQGSFMSHPVGNGHSHQLPTMNSLYNFTELHHQTGGTHGLGGHQEFFDHEKRTNNPHIEIHVLPECSSYPPQQPEKETIDSLDSELTTHMMFSNHVSVPNQCYLQPNSPLGGLSRASSGSFQSSELNSSESPYFSIFEHGNFSPNGHSNGSNCMKGHFEIDVCNSHNSTCSRPNTNSKSAPNKHNYSSGMQNILMWLKNLRLHKYTEIFKYITYDELMNMTDVWLDNHNVTQGAKNKILINIAKLHDRSTLLEVMKNKLTNMRHTQYSNSLVSLKGCLSDLRQILLSPIHPYVEGPPVGYSNGLTQDYKTEDLPSLVLECILKVTDFCCSLESVDYDSQARLLEIYNLIGDNEAFTQVQKETVVECQNQVLSVHGTESLQAKNTQQNRFSPRSGISNFPSNNHLNSSDNGVDADIMGNSYSQSLLFAKKMVERTYSEPYKGNGCEMNGNNSYLMASHDTLDCNNAKLSNIIYNTSNMSLACTDNFSNNTISHLGSSNTQISPQKQTPKEFYTMTSQNEPSENPSHGKTSSNNSFSDSTALINHNLDQLTKKVTQLAIQESDQSE